MGSGNESLDVLFDIGIGNQDVNAMIDIAKRNQGWYASIKLRDVIQNSRDAIDEVDAKDLELAQAFRSLGTEGICQSVCINTALYPIHVDWFLDICCIPKYVA